MVAIRNPLVDKNDKRYRYRATTSTTGNMSLDVDFPFGKLPEKEQSKALATASANIVQRMMESGYIKFFSSSDISKRYGNTRQYWEKLFNEGKIPFQKTTAGRISTNLWVEGYLDQSTRNSYPREVLEMRRRIVANEKSGNKIKRIPCVRCGEEFNYNYNQGHHINGLCSCGFRLDTIE